MAKFVDKITRLTQVVLGPETPVHVTEDANTRGKRVDIMVRERGGVIYVFAVRVTEPETEYDEVFEPESLSVTFSIGAVNDAEAQVFDEDRTVPVRAGTFTDTFERNAVHIYVIAPGDVRPAPPSDMRIVE